MPSRVQAAPLRPAQPSNMALWGQFTYGRGAPRGLPGASGGGGCPIGRVPHQGATHAEVRARTNFRITAFWSVQLHPLNSHGPCEAVAMVFAMRLPCSLCASIISPHGRLCRTAGSLDRGRLPAKGNSRHNAAPIGGQLGPRPVLRRLILPLSQGRRARFPFTGALYSSAAARRWPSGCKQGGGVCVMMLSAHHLAACALWLASLGLAVRMLAALCSAFKVHVRFLNKTK